MKCIDFKTFEKQKSSLYLILSKEEYSRTRGSKIVLEAFKGAAVSKFSADRLKTLEPVLDELLTKSLFHAQKVVFITDIEAQKAPFFEPLLRAFDAVLVLVGASLSKATKLYKLCEAEGVVLDLPEQKPWEVASLLQSFVLDFAKLRGKGLSPHLAKVIVSEGGSDQALLENELIKLVTYVGDRGEITEADIKKCVIKGSVDTGWQLGEALLQLDGKRALEVLSNEIEGGTPFIALLRQLRAQMVTGYTVLSLSSQADEIASRYPYLKGSLLEKTVRNATHFGASRFKRALIALDDIELKAKNSGLSDEILGDLLIGRLL